MILESVKLFAMLIAMWAVYEAFNPKYRYNEHCKWKPDVFEHCIVWLLIGILWIAIIK